VDEDEGHLEEDLELGGDDIRSAIGEGLGAVASLEEEAASFLGIGDVLAEALDLSAGDERGEFSEPVDGGIDSFAVLVDDLLRGDLGLP
jgi:hypothetical protein